MSWGLGAFAGGLHALTGPDHLAVLLPSCIGVPWSQAYKSGAFWGLGHGIGATMFGLAGFAFRDWLNIEAASRFLEPVIGITLVVIAFQGQIGMGMLCSRSSRRAEMREVKVFLLEKDEEKGGKEDAEVEESIEIADDTVIGGRRSVGRGRDGGEKKPESEGKLVAPAQKLGTVAAVATGVLHGFTGTGHLVGVMPALAMSSWGPALVYLCGFCLGTLLTMAAFTAMVGSLSVRLQKRTGPAAVEQVSRMASVLAAMVGGWIVLRWALKGEGDADGAAGVN